MESQESNKNEENQYPQSFFCPLTLELMKDPVVDPEGNTFEREAIQNWLKTNHTSPITRNPLSVNDLVPNRALRDAIEEKRSKNPNKNPAPPVKIAVPIPPPKKEEIVNVDQDAVSLSISGLKNYPGISEEESIVMISLKPPKGTQATPLDIVCVVDISGSMGSEAKTQNSSGVVEGHGLSLLDIVKHAVKTIIHILTPNDRLSLVSFSNTAKTVFSLIPMDSSGKARALKEVEKLAPDDTTNLWDGLYTGLEVIRQSNNKSGHLQSVLLLTDGLPNVVPPRGHLPMLKRYKNEHPEINCTINTFGFGYSLDSGLLQDLSIYGNGMYAFIPDSGFVGTSFVHTISNLLATIATNTQLTVDLMNGVKIEDGIIGGHPSDVIPNGVKVHIGSIQYEQQKNILFKVKIPKDLPVDMTFMTATLTYLPRGFDKPVDLKIDCKISNLNGDSEVEVQYFRLQTVDTIRHVMTVMKKEEFSQAKDSVKSLIQSIKKSPASKDFRIKELLQDIEGQVTEAISRKDYYNKWGIHFLPSLMNAHLLQMCNNFKDPGVQIYGGKLFSDQRDRADDIFVKLPPPKPSVRPSAPPVTSMNYYHSSANPCFHGNSIVKMGDGSFKKVVEIKKGMIVATPSCGNAKVKCVVKTLCKGTSHLVQLGNGLLITPFHPVRVEGRWEFPHNLGEVKDLPCDAVYSFVLEREHIMIINEVECVTLGHDLQEEVVKHPYFGSQKIIEDLKKMRGWNLGLIELYPGCLVREISTSLVNGIKQELPTQNVF